MTQPYSEIAAASLDLPLSAAAFKASHNAYEIDKVSLADQLAWTPETPQQGGCRGIELDVHQEEKDTDHWRWSVSHDGKYDSDPDTQLSAYLRVLARWAATPSQVHGPMLVHIDLKDSFFDHSKFADQIDLYIQSALPGVSFYYASTLLGGNASLLDAVTARGWPTVGDLRHKVLVCLTGNQAARTDTYIAQMVAGKKRLCFCDREITEDLGSGTQVTVSKAPNRLILNFDMMSGDCQVPVAGSIDALPQVLLRAYALPPSLWRDAVNAGANILSMDILKFGSMNVDPPLYAPAKGR